MLRMPSRQDYLLILPLWWAFTASRDGGWTLTLFGHLRIFNLTAQLELYM